jgi:membrane protease YdiL (CAAX protease family)
VIFLVQLAPALAYIATVLIFKDMYIPIKIYIRKIILLKIFLAIFIPFIILFSIYCFNILFNLKLSASVTLLTVTRFLWIIVGAIGEEIGWRSFLQPMLEKKYTVIVSSLIVGVIWGLWHIPVYWQGGLVFVMGFLFFIISSSIIMAILQRNTQKNLIISSAYHATINITIGIFFVNTTEEVKVNLIFGIVFSVIAMTIILIYRKYYFIKAK